MDPFKQRSPSVLSDHNSNVQDDVISRTSPFSVSSPMKSSPNSSENDKEFGEDDRENKPPENIASDEEIVFKKPSPKENMPKEDNGLNSLIDGLTHLKLGSTPVPDKRFNYSKWTTPLRKPVDEIYTSPGCSAGTSKDVAKEIGASQNDDVGSEYYDCSDDDKVTSDQTGSDGITSDLFNTTGSSFHSAPDKEEVDSTLVLGSKVNETALAEMNRIQACDGRFILEKYLQGNVSKSLVEDLEISLSDVSITSIDLKSDQRLSLITNVPDQKDERIEETRNISPIPGPSGYKQGKRIEPDSSVVPGNIARKSNQFSETGLFTKNVDQSEDNLLTTITDYLIQTETYSTFDMRPQENIFSFGNISEAGFFNVHTTKDAADGSNTNENLRQSSSNVVSTNEHSKPADSSIEVKCLPVHPEVDISSKEINNLRLDSSIQEITDEETENPEASETQIASSEDVSQTNRSYVSIDEDTTEFQTISDDISFKDGIEFNQTLDDVSRCITDTSNDEKFSKTVDLESTRVIETGVSVLNQTVNFESVKVIEEETNETAFEVNLNVTVNLESTVIRQDTSDANLSPSNKSVNLEVTREIHEEVKDSEEEKSNDNASESASSDLTYPREGPLDESANLEITRTIAEESGSSAGELDTTGDSATTIEADENISISSQGASKLNKTAGPIDNLKNTPCANQSEYSNLDETSTRMQEIALCYRNLSIIDHDNSIEPNETFQLEITRPMDQEDTSLESNTTSTMPMDDVKTETISEIDSKDSYSNISSDNEVIRQTPELINSSPETTHNTSPQFVTESVFVCLPTSPQPCAETSREVAAEFDMSVPSPQPIDSSPEGNLQSVPEFNTESVFVLIPTSSQPIEQESSQVVDPVSETLGEDSPKPDVKSVSVHDPVTTQLHDSSAETICEDTPEPDAESVSIQTPVTTKILDSSAETVHEDASKIDEVVAVPAQIDSPGEISNLNTESAPMTHLSFTETIPEDVPKPDARIPVHVSVAAQPLDSSEPSHSQFGIATGSTDDAPFRSNSPVEFVNKWSTQIDLSAVDEKLKCISAGIDLNSSDDMDQTDPLETDITETPEIPLIISSRTNRSHTGLAMIPEINESDITDEQDSADGENSKHEAFKTVNLNETVTLCDNEPAPSELLEADSCPNPHVESTPKQDHPFEVSVSEATFKTPIIKLSQSDLMLCDSSFNADYRAGTSNGNQFRNLLISPRRSMCKDTSIYSSLCTSDWIHEGETDDVPASLMDMSLMSLQKYASTQLDVAASIENVADKTIDADEPKCEEIKLLCIDEPSRKINVKTQTHDTELHDLRNENIQLKENLEKTTAELNKLKEITVSLAHNETELKRVVKELEDNNRILNNRYELLKEYSNRILTEQNEELEKVQDEAIELRKQLRNSKSAEDSTK